MMSEASHTSPNDTIKVPKFASEAEEADWWFENQNLVAEAFQSAAENGTLRRTTLSDRLNRIPVTLDPSDAALARELARKRGQSYEEFVRKVMHRALELEKTA